MPERFRQPYENLLGRKLPATSGNPNVLTICFHHEEETPSCSVDLATGLWYCHAHNEGGTFERAVSLVRNVTMAEAGRQAKALGAASGSTAAKPPATLPQAFEDRYIEALEAAPDRKAFARTKFGWSDETMSRRRIGWDQMHGRFVFPIRDGDGDIVNFRLYKPDHSGGDKVINWKAGYGAARLYPYSALESDTIVLVEGEKDQTIMDQVLHDNRTGWSALTGTGGAGTWDQGWTELFKGKTVYIAYDRDAAGEAAAARVARSLARVAKQVKIVVLDIVTPEGADVSDYFVQHSKGWDDFKKLVDGSEIVEHRGRGRPKRQDHSSKALTPHLSEASSAKFLFQETQVKVLVSGKDLAPFAVPKQVEYECPMAAGQMCNGCAMAAAGGRMAVDYSADDPQLLSMIGLPNERLDAQVRRDNGIARKCGMVNMTITDYHNIEETTVVPEIDFADEDQEYVSRTAFVVEHGVRPNRVYLMTGISLPHPKTQHVVHFVPALVPAADNIDSFEMDDVKADRLRIFQPKDGQSVADKMEEIANDLSANITRIYGRNDLVQAVDLCYHTVIAFEFQGKAVAKAWGDILIIGDTRTGKTETVQALINHYRLGEMTAGESASFAGLVGGLRQESGKRWSISWGRLPLNDRRLLAVDETSGLSLDDIGKLSGIRSNGVAELTKIVTQRTWARTRLIMISNPRSTLGMGQHSFGVEAVKHLIGRPEDIARFDIVVAAATNEIPISTINAVAHDHVPHQYTSELCRMLVLWAWSRKSDDVVFTKEAEELCLETATEQAKNYSSEGGIPLVEGGNHRIKLAKLAVAAACRTFSTDDGRRVIVEPRHVEYAANLIERVYAKRSLDYAGWSNTMLGKKNVAPAQLDEARTWITEHPDWTRMWIENHSLRLDDFRTAFDLEAHSVRADIFKPLSAMHMIERTQYGYRKTSAFIDLIKEIGTGDPAAVSVPSSERFDDSDIPF